MSMNKSESQYEIAVTGYACRLPQAPNHDAFWGVLERGDCVITEIGRDRFEPDFIYDPDPSALGKSYTVAAGQVENIWDFDPGFFNLSPREAVQMDPQQRILLQVVWEALEHAGLRPSDLQGKRTGVFIGAASSDHSTSFLGDIARIDAQFMTGNTLSIISNRISYLLDLHGPSYTVDTACSSSLYALHEACRNLMRDEIDTAIVGGVNLLIAPGPFVGFSRATMLSRDGRCKAFDASANGYVRSEGAVVFVLRRMAAARANGDRVRGILAGTGINSDGRTVGMALPSAERQTELLSRMRERFDIDPDDLAFIEAHGTGTPVGDPIEAHAIGTVFGKPRATALPIGSVKSNFGHLEPASGLVGLMKAQMALERGVLPASLHVSELNPNIDFEALKLTVATEAQPVPARQAPWFAGVNSFGFGGANAHALLRQPDPLPDGSAAPVRSPGALAISAASAQSLKALAQAWRDRLEGAPDEEVARLTNAAVWRRESFQNRLVVLGEDAETLGAGLDSYLAGERSRQAFEGRSTPGGAGTAFLFSGNGSQWAGMGRHLYAGDPAFRRRFDEIAALFAEQGDEDLAALLEAEDLESRLGSARIAQPILFAVQLALVAALDAQGLRPGAVLGHSVGEVAAACTAGIISVPDGVQLVHTRSMALDTLRGQGGMAAISTDAAELERALAESGISGVSIAGINSPRSVTVSGATDRIKALLAWLKRNRRIAGVMLDVEIPYHSAAVEPLRRRMIEDLKGLKPEESGILFASSTTGQLANGKSLDTDYWWRNARDVVRFEDGIEALTEAGYRCFVEISPRPVLVNYVRDKLRAMGCSGTCIPSMDQGRLADQSAREIAARAHAAGADLDTETFFGPRVSPAPDLPAYPWDNAPYRAPASAGAIDLWASEDFHPLIGRAPVPGTAMWQGDINTRSLPWLADHVVDGAAVFPAAGFVEMALAAGRRMLGADRVELSDFEILRPLVLEADGGADTRVTGDALTGSIRIEARPRLSTGDWALHAIGSLRVAPVESAPVPEAPKQARETGAAELYPQLAGLGLAYGPQFRLAGTVRHDESSAAAAIDAAGGPRDARFVLNPAQLDAALHLVFPILIRFAEERGLAADTVFLPVRIGRLRLFAAGADAAEARVEITRRTARGIEIRVLLLDGEARPVVEATGLRLQATRLRGRGQRETTVWRQRLVRLRAPDRHVVLPSAWNGPDARLRALGVAADEAPEPDAGALLIDAACRRIAWNSCRALADEAGRIAELPAGVDRAALPELRRMLEALAEDGLYTADEAGGTLAETCSYPELDRIIETLMETAPERAAEVVALMALETGLPSILRDGPSPDAAPPAGLDLSAGSRAIWPLMARVAEDLAASWSGTERLNMLLLGRVPATLLAALEAHPRVDGITISAPEERQVEMMRQTLPAGPKTRVVPPGAALDPFAHDVVISVNALQTLSEDERDRLSASLALSGILVAVETAPALLHDLQQAILYEPEDRFQPALREGLEELLAPAFRNITVQPLATAAVEASILTARPRQQAVRASLPDTGEREQRQALLVLADRRKPSLHLASLVEASLSAAGIEVRQCLAGDTLDLQGDVGEVIHLAHLPQLDSDPLDTAELRIETLRDILAMHERPDRVWVVTSGGRPAANGAGGARNPCDAASWGAVRVAVNEYPAVRFHTVDFAPETAPETLAEELCSLILAETPETEIACDASGFLAPRIEPAALPDRERQTGEALRLDIGHQSVLDTLDWRRVERRAPGPGEVEIEVRATGLNFRDLMWAQGLLPEEALQDGFAGATLGMECSGIVIRAGRGSGFRRGDEVIAFAPACFATHVTVSAEAVARLPAGTSLDTAAAIPTIFVTAQYALCHLAGLRAGETLLVHGGAGGVGLAALQIARRLGARVFATAGTPGKRRLLEHLGAEAVFDSRSLQFADQVMEATGGAGVDAVLNSLAGEAMERSLACLKPFGRFIELGKRDFYANTRLGLRPFRRNLSYFGVDADLLLKERRDIAETLLAEIAQGFADGSYAPPPCQILEGAEVVDAFRLMQQSRHIGKIIVRPPARPQPMTERAAKPIRGAWLIAGGLGGFGLATARWLAAQGAEALWLVSRSGAPHEVDAEALEALRASGVALQLRAVDVTDRAALETLLHEIVAGDLPLRGVVHAAMVLDDALSADLDRRRIRAVMAPKIRGAENLDALTRDLELDHFVLYSSVTTLFGNPGQLAYVAANTALESLAARRREAGLPGLAIGWGPIGDSGYLSRDTETRDRLARRLGARLLSAEEALEALGRLLASPPEEAAVTVAPMRWRALAADLRLLSTPLFARIDMEESGGMGEGVADLLAMIEGLDDAAAAQKIAEALTVETARILRQPVTDIDPYQPLTELGFDSLMAMDLKLAAEESMGVTIPILSVGDGMTLVQLSQRIVAQLRGKGGMVTGVVEGDRIVEKHLGEATETIEEDIVQRVTERAERIG
ncbi:MAG: SDR family NAD(P)-dependent oxidoreductase [Alphaproteobacteria bacterium]|nr:MAG: SDR family NAD(P)-dependent oxidoreductase [Alphaproteobacteria bacterium]